MPYRWDHGWGGAVLLVCFVLFPALALVVRWKWRLAEARRAEIIRLMRLATAEAERAQREAALFPSASELPASIVIGGVTGMSNCAVCHRPTTTRCARCKVVKYCSGKCQIIHWRIGHKDECHPPPVGHFKGLPHVADLKGAHAEKPEISDNRSEIEAHNRRNDDHSSACQNVSTMGAGQAQETIFGHSGSQIEEKLDGVQYFETSFYKSMPSKSDFPSETYSQIGNIRQKPSANSLGKERYVTSASTGSTLLGSVDISDVAFSSVLHSGAEPGRHCNASSSHAFFAKLDKSSSSNTLEGLTKISNSEKDHECQEIVVENFRSTDFTEFCTPCSSTQTQLDAKLHSINRLEPTDTKSSCIEKLCSVTNGQKSKEQFKSLSSSLEDFSLVSTKSLMTSDSLLNDKVVVEEGTKKKSFSSLGHVQPGVCNYGSLKYNYKMLFSYDLFIKLYNSDKVGLNPCGLINCGNSCYANAALQCLAFTRPLAAYLLEGLHAKTCSKKEWCFTCAFESLLMKANNGKSPVSPVEIISHIQDIGSSFSQGREEDAHEFLRHAIDAMQSTCLEEAGANAVAELEETTLIRLIFGGYLHSKIKCLRCKGKSERRERMMDLTVEMHGDTLENALARFTAMEVMEGENKYKCGRCKSYERAKKQLTILEAPNVLTIALKRYQSGKFGKLNKMIRFPEFLNLAPYMKGSDDKSPVYRLFAVVVHNDVMNSAFSGHYACYVKNAVGKWFKADDSVVKQVELQAVLCQGAYMLLYARCSPRAPSLLRKKIANKNRAKQNGDSRNSKAGSFSKSSHPGKNQAIRSYDPKLGLHDLFDERLRQSELDMSSDSSSLFSFSDEGSSWSAESTKDSATTEDFTESINGEPGLINCNSPDLRFSEDLDGFTLPPNSNVKISESPDLSPMDSKMVKGIGRDGEGGLQGIENPSFLYSTKQFRNLTEQCNSSHTNWVSSSEVRPSVLLKRSSRDTTAQTFYY